MRYEQIEDMVHYMHASLAIDNDEQIVNVESLRYFEPCTIRVWIAKEIM